MSYGCSAHYGEWKLGEVSGRFRKEKSRSCWTDLENSRRFRKQTPEESGRFEELPRRWTLFWKVPWKLEGRCMAATWKHLEVCRTFQVWKYEHHPGLHIGDT